MHAVASMHMIDYCYVLYTLGVEVLVVCLLAQVHLGKTDTSV